MRNQEMGGFTPESEKKEGLTEKEKLEWDELRKDPDVIKYYKDKDKKGLEDSHPINHPDLQEKFGIIEMLERKAGVEFIPEEE
ncbi:MAG: hypothetical protein Athens101410_369 [Parcubacteria group bacterium Athens1014_10]|nr:MAG: hypothetical protein Athens101410_369 [Parcubacteria group bacterium Athens1014_10]TSD05119.1 MAG: hypothetical protein Athens071412_488 [Parcubacteria group bacterium Athens0714_12]